MSKTILIFLFLISLIEVNAQHVKYKRIGITNPTPANIEKVIYMIQHHFIDADSFQIVGVFHELQKESIKTSKQFISEHGYGFITFSFIIGRVPLDSLFLKNSWTSIFSKIFQETDAMIFFGGADIPPAIYGEKTFLTTELIPEEQNWEISFLYHLTGGSQHSNYIPLLEQRPDYVILGICLGMQEMNVAAGGSLYQDIPSQLYGLSNYEDVLKLPVENQHKNYWNTTTQNNYTAINFHHVNLMKSSYLDSIKSKSSPMVASVHHQSVKKAGKDYKIIATSEDKKVVEAIQHEKYKNVYGIQFHTDILSLYDENMIFRIAPNRTIQLNKDDRLFHINFWKNFGKRLMQQK